MADQDDTRFTRMEDKIDHIVDKIGNIEVTLAKQHVSLEEHMRRSKANEEAVEIISKELKPVLNHVAIVSFIGKVLLTLIGSGMLVQIVRLLVGK